MLSQRRESAPRPHDANITNRPRGCFNNKTGHYSIKRLGKWRISFSVRLHTLDIFMNYTEAAERRPKDGGGTTALKASRILTTVALPSSFIVPKSTIPKSLITVNVIKWLSRDYVTKTQRKHGRWWRKKNKLCYILKRKGLGTWRVWVSRGGCVGSWWGNRREGDHWEDLGVDGWIILGWISRRWDVGIWTGLGWRRIETGGGRLWVR